MVLLSETKRNCSGCCCRQLDSFLTMVRGKNRRSCRNAAGRNTRLSGDRGRGWHCCTTWAGVGLLMGLFAPLGSMTAGIGLMSSLSLRCLLGCQACYCSPAGLGIAKGWLGSSCAQMPAIPVGCAPHDCYEHCNLVLFWKEGAGLCCSKTLHCGRYRFWEFCGLKGQCMGKISQGVKVSGWERASKRTSHWPGHVWCSLGHELLAWETAWHWALWAPQ